MRFNAKKVNDTLLKLELHPAVFSTQATRALIDAFGVTKLTASKWLDRTLNLGVIEYKQGHTGFQLVDQEAKGLKKARMAHYRDSIDSGKVISLHSARVKRNRERKSIAV